MKKKSFYLVGGSCYLQQYDVFIMYRFVRIDEQVVIVE